MSQFKSYMSTLTPEGIAQPVTEQRVFSYKSQGSPGLSKRVQAAINVLQRPITADDNLNSTQRLLFDPKSQSSRPIRVGSSSTSGQRS